MGPHGGGWGGGDTQQEIWPTDFPTVDKHKQRESGSGSQPNIDSAWNWVVKGESLKYKKNSASLHLIGDTFHEQYFNPNRICIKSNFKRYCCIHKQKESSRSNHSLFVTKVSGMQ